MTLDLDELLILVVFALMIVFVIPGCSTPVTWHSVDREELALQCRDGDPKLRGCLISKSDGDHIYTLPVCQP